MHTHNRFEIVLLLVGDVACFVGALYLSLVLRSFEIPSSSTLLLHIKPFSGLFLLWIGIFFIVGLYDKQTLFLKSQLPSRIVSTQFINVVLAAMLFFVMPNIGIAPKTVLFIYLVMSSVLIVWWRLRIYPGILPRHRERVLLIGEGSEIEELFFEVNTHVRYNFEFIRFGEHQGKQSNKHAEGNALLEVIERERVSTIVADTRNERITPLLPLVFNLTLLDTKFSFFDAAKVYEDIFGRVPLSFFKYTWFLEQITLSSHIVYDIAKRGIDIIGALLLGLLCLVAYPFIALAIKFDDGGAVFIRQDRLGLHNSRIRVYKFRTRMQNDSGVWEGENKNIPTRVGYFLRKTSLDELPQAWNILIGEMSLVGPRNDIIGIATRLEETIPYYPIRYVVKPGVTGWAQTHQAYAPGRISPQSLEESKVRLAYDLYYIKNRSFLLDISIALRTVRTLLERLGVKFESRRIIML
jgi:lipopolysaccharide/colanic/teichoic acid biosynthesis glycosyltransferase